MAPLTALVGVITSRIVMRQPHLPWRQFQLTLAQTWKEMRRNGSHVRRTGAHDSSLALDSVKLLLRHRQGRTLKFNFEERPYPKGALDKRTANDRTVFHSVVAMCVANQEPAKCPRLAADLLGNSI